MFSGSEVLQGLITGQDRKTQTSQPSMLQSPISFIEMLIFYVLEN